MKRTFLLGLCLASTVAYADCMVKTDINLSLQKIELGPTDIQKMVSSEGTGKSCSIRYRVNINDEWKTAEGVGQGATEAEACKQAMNLHNGILLAEVEPSKVSANTQMVCSSLENIQIRQVKIGETIWESEVDIHRHPKERRYFDYKQTKCRMFTERNNRDKNLYTYQGVICKITTAPGSKWRVVDKY
jgi:hypothetical protein